MPLGTHQYWLVLPLGTTTFEQILKHLNHIASFSKFCSNIQYYFSV